MFQNGNAPAVRTRRHVACRGVRRRAVITVELILALPVLLVLVLAVVEFGMIFAAIQQVAFASRHGAKIAAEEPPGSLPTLNTSAGGSRLRTRIDQLLETNGFASGACRVILEHNLSGMDEVQVDDDPAVACDCQPPAAALPASGVSVRVTVCVPLEGNVPDLLASFGFSLDGRTVVQSTTWRYEH